MFEALHWKLEAVMGEELPQPSLDLDRKKPRATVAQYSSMLAESRIAHLEGWLERSYSFLLLFVLRDLNI